MRITKPISELFFRIDGQTNSGTAVQVVSPPCPQDQLWAPNFASAQNNSGESTTIQFCLKRGTVTIEISIDNTVADGAAISTNVLPLVGPGEQIGVQVKGAAKASTVHLVLSGWIYHERQEPPAELLADFMSWVKGVS